MHPVNIYDLINESAEWLRNHGVSKIDFGLILGSGLGEVVDQFNVVRSFDYSDIPHLAGTAVVSHVGVHVAGGLSCPDHQGIGCFIFYNHRCCRGIEPFIRGRGHCFFERSYQPDAGESAKRAS